MKLGTVIQGITGNVLKIQLEAIWTGSVAVGKRGGAFFNMATIQTIKNTISNMKQKYLDAVLNCHFSYVCLLNVPSKQNVNIFQGDLTEFRGSRYSRSKLCKLDI